MAESAAAHKEEKISEAPKISRDELKRLKSEKIAIITIGRWQPPHAGHLELIDGTYNKVIEMRKAGFRNVNGFIWITPRPDEVPGSTSNPTFINKNPLYFIDKWLYLNYIIPYDEYGKNLKFLTITDIDSDINRKIFRDDNDPNKASFLTDRHDLREGGKIQDLSMCQQEKYSSLFYYGDEDFKNFKKRTTKINVRNQSTSPSATCINFLKSRGYTQLLLLVGSDRVDAFEKYNRAHLDSAFGAGNGIIEQIGAERGSAGKGLLFDLNSGSDDDANIAAGIMEQCSLTGRGCGGNDDGEEKRGAAADVSIAGRFSGTRIRNCAYNLEDLDYFCEGTIIGDMTKKFSFCLLNDLRKRHIPELPSITKKQWNDLVSPEYQFFGVGLEHDELASRLALAQYGYFGGRKKKTRRKQTKRKTKKRRRKRKYKTKKHKKKKRRRRSRKKR